MAIIPSDLSPPTLARIVLYTRVFEVVPVTCLVYDHLTTLDQEVEYIWKSAKTASTIIYIILRYIGSAWALFYSLVYLLPIFDNEVGGHVFVLIQGWPPSFIMWTAQVVLQLRLYALYNRSKKVMLFVVSLFVAEILSQTAILLYGIIEAEKYTGPLPSAPTLPSWFRLCVSVGVSGIYLYWIPTLVFEFTMCLLVVWASLQYSREESGDIRVNSKSPLLGALIRGSVAFYIVFFVPVAVNFAIEGIFSSEWTQVPLAFPHAVAVIAGCHLILHIRHVAFQQDRRPWRSDELRVTS